MISIAATPPPKPIQSPVTYTPTNSYAPESCIQLVNSSLPVNSSILDSHILYEGVDPQTNDYKVKVYSIEDNSIKLLSNYRWSSQGIGFLKDGYHFVLATGDTTATLGDLDNSAPVSVNIDDKLLSNFQPYSGLWSVLAMDIHSYSPPLIEVGDILDVYSPDGQKIAHWSGGAPALVIKDKKANTTVDVIKTDPAGGISGTWTLDGSKFIFADNSGTPDNFGTKLYSVDRDGSNLTPLTTYFAGAAVQQVLLSPDDTRLLFLISFIPKQGISSDYFGILELRSAELRIIPHNVQWGTTLDAAQGEIVWSPDSQWITYFADWKGQIDIRVTNIEDGKTYCITNDPFIEDLMDWR